MTDPTNAALTGLRTSDGRAWSTELLDALRIPEASLPEVVDSSGQGPEAIALDGAPPICGIAGDQQASLVGQGCVRPGLAKITFGTGGMLDLCLGAERPVLPHPRRGRHVPDRRLEPRRPTRRGASRRSCSRPARTSSGSATTSASSPTPRRPTTSRRSAPTPRAWCSCPRSSASARRSGTTAPGARCSASPGAPTGPRIVRAVLEGVAHRGADLVEAAETDGGIADPVAAHRRRHVGQPDLRAGAGRRQRPAGRGRPVLEATTLGAGLLAGLAVGTWAGEDDVAATWSPAQVVEPARQLDRDRWADACRRAGAWFPELSALDF